MSGASLRPFNITLSLPGGAENTYLCLPNCGLHVRHVKRLNARVDEACLYAAEAIERQQMEDDNKALALAKWVSDKAIEGLRPLSSAHDLADEYLLDSGYANHDPPCGRSYQLGDEQEFHQRISLWTRRPIDVAGGDSGCVSGFMGHSGQNGGHHSENLRA
jgi:hypothetical protein